MKAILINPAERSIAYVETRDELADFHRLVGSDCLDWCRPFAGLREAAIVDDSGATTSPRPPAFEIVGYHHPLFGRALVLGYNGAGASRSTMLTIEQVAELVNFD
jgi:hypothetical protein